MKLLSLAQPASPPDDPIAPRPLFDSLLGGMAGLMGGIVGVYVRRVCPAPGALLRKTFEGVLGRPSRWGRSAHCAQGPLMDRIQGSRDLQRARLAIEYQTVGSPVTRLLVASPDAGDGRTTVAAALALSFAPRWAVRRCSSTATSATRPSPNGSAWERSTPIARRMTRDTCVRSGCSRCPSLQVVPASFVHAPTVSAMLERVALAVRDAVAAGAEVVIVDSPASSRPSPTPA